MRYIIKQKKLLGSIIQVMIDLTDEKMGIIIESKEGVINSIEKYGIKYKTRDINNNTSDVYVVDHSYLRTKADNIKNDNLGELPLF